MEPYNYAQILQAGQNLVPDEQLRDAQLNQYKIQARQAEQQLNQSQRAQNEQDAFQSDLDGYLMAPTPQATSALLLKHPKFAATIKQSYELQDAETRRMDMGQKVSIYSAARAGNYELAAKTLEVRIASERAAGQNVDDDEAALAAMRSENPQERGAVLGMLQIDLAASDPERFAATFKALNDAEQPNLRSVNAGDIVIDERTGKQVYASPYKPQLVQIRNADGSTSVVEYAQGGGESVSSGAPVSAPVAGGAFLPSGIAGETVTSRYRSAEKNKSVGGVANSYHTRKDDNGNALARDSTPPAGMSMAEYYAKLKQQNPDLDVINEGDHVHMEPQSVRQTPASLRADAEAAIAKGAPRAAVMARLGKMLKEMK